jgi:hypothetical protein
MDLIGLGLMAQGFYGFDTDIIVLFAITNCFIVLILFV